MSYTSTQAKLYVEARIFGQKNHADTLNTKLLKSAKKLLLVEHYFYLKNSTKKEWLYLAK